MKVLIIDDEAAVGGVLADILDTFGVEAEVVSEPDVAFDRLINNSYDSVFCDVRMPTLTGDQLFAKAKSLKTPPNYRKWYFMSAFSDINKERALELGADGFLEKPFDFDLVANLCEG